MAAIAPDAMMDAPHDAVSRPVTAETALHEPPRPSFWKSGSFGSVGGGAQKKRRRSSSQIAPISSPEDMDDLSRKLQAAKQAGQVARLRTSGTCLAVGVVAFCCGLGLNIFIDHYAASQLGAIIAIVVGAPATFAAVLPTDRRLVYGCLYLAVFMFSLNLALQLVRAVRFQAPEEVDLCVAEFGVRRWYCSWWRRSGHNPPTPPHNTARA